MLRAALPAVALALAGAAAAQDAAQLPSQVLTVDQERLFNESLAAERLSEEIERRSEELAAENRTIEADLVAEELRLTEMRPDMDPSEFRALADAFDEKVQRIREEQDTKARDLQRMRERERQEFLSQITPVLTALVRERGAVIVLDRRSVFLSADRIDITDEAIARFNAELAETEAARAAEDGAAPPPEAGGDPASPAEGDAPAAPPGETGQ